MLHAVLHAQEVHPLQLCGLLLRRQLLVAHAAHG
jgi:hypothetical protein